MIQDRNNSTEFKDQIRYRSTNLEYHIKRSKRIKTSELIVDSDRIEVRTPLNKSLEDTRNIILGKAEWILKKQKQYQQMIQDIIIPTFEENSTLPYLGKNYPLKINKNQSTNAMRFVDGEFVADITNSDVNENAKSQARELYEGWLRRSAYPVLETKTKLYAQKLGTNVQNISIKSSLKSRWASLTKTDSINFNMHLIKAPQEVIDYIVLHEVCHLKIKGNSHHYWDLVYRYMPNYQEKINWLNVNGKVLIGSDKITSEPQYQRDK
jgi:predicted metal-dependent hydrolase